MPHPNIKHVVVLMLENRSYDHCLGFLGTGDGVDPDTHFNRVDPSNNRSRKLFVGATAKDAMEPDPGHGFDEVSEQLFGTTTVPTRPVAKNSGFALSFSRKKFKKGKPGVAQIMECFEPDSLPSLSHLAREFVVCDRWFSSVPGPTWPNRFFVHCATADGELEVRPGPWAIGIRKYRMRTVFQALTEARKSWRIYSGDIAHAVTLANLRDRAFRDNFKRLEDFHEHVRRKEIASYTFIEPRYFGLGRGPANDQHPPHSMRRGDALIADIYDILRETEDVWKQCLLIVTYDEHGGFYDHVPPPFDGDPAGTKVPNPDATQLNPRFDFRRLGVRVPTVIASPWVGKGVVHSEVLEHSSIPATLRELFDLGEPLTARDREAGTVTGLLGTEMRIDTPKKLKRPPQREMAMAAKPEAEDAELSDLQLSLLDAAAVLELEERETMPQPPTPARAPAPRAQPLDPRAAGQYAANIMDRWTQSGR